MGVSAKMPGDGMLEVATVIGTVTIILVSMTVILAAWHSDNLSFGSKLFVSASLSASVIVNSLGIYKHITAVAV